MMTSAEENKFQSDFTDTASSDFYTSKPFAPSPSENYQAAPSTDNLEDQLSRVRETLVTSNELLQRLSSNQELLKYVQEVQQQLDVVRARGSNELANVKLSFEKNYNSLERQLAAYKKGWKSLKDKAEAQLDQELSCFRNDLNKNQKTLTKMIISTTAELRDKIATVGQEIKITRQNRKDSVSGLMGLIEAGRAKLEAITEGERKRRQQYQRIVVGLLDRTVDQGERIMRRIC